MSTTLQDGRAGSPSLLFKCHNGHEFVVTLRRMTQLSTLSVLDDLCQKSWCIKCKNFHEKAIQRATREGCTLISDPSVKSVYKFRCHKSHEFSILWSRVMPKVWCKGCKRDDAQLLKLQREKLAQQAFLKQQEEQRQLFDQYQTQHVEQEALDLSLVTSRVRDHVQSFLSSSPDSSLSSEQLHAVYWVLLLPLESLSR